MVIRKMRIESTNESENVLFETVSYVHSNFMHICISCLWAMVKVHKTKTLYQHYVSTMSAYR